MWSISRICINYLTLFVKFTGQHRRIVVEGKPCTFTDSLALPLLLQPYNVQREIIIRHYPEWIEMRVGRKDISHMDRLFPFGLNNNNLVTLVMTAREDRSYTVNDPCFAVNQLKVAAVF